MGMGRGYGWRDVGVAVVCVVLLGVCLGAAGYGARQRSRLVHCGAQLRLIGQAVGLYQNDFTGDGPTVCGVPWDHGWYFFGGSAYNSVVDPLAKTRWWRWDWRDNTHWPNDPEEARTSWAAYPTVGGSWYLLMKYEGLVPRVFVCPSAPSDQVMELQIAKDEDSSGFIQDWDDLRDFASMYNLSYGMHDPFNRLIRSDSKAGLAIAADKNPKFDNQSDGGVGSEDDDIDSDPWNITDEREFLSKNHNKRAMNVLFMDMAVKRTESAMVGIGGENIFTYWTNNGADEDDRTYGSWGDATYDNLAQSDEDSYIGQ